MLEGGNPVEAGLGHPGSRTPAAGVGNRVLAEGGEVLVGIQQLIDRGIETAARHLGHLSGDLRLGCRTAAQQMLEAQLHGAMGTNRLEIAGAIKLGFGQLTNELTHRDFALAQTGLSADATLALHRLDVAKHLAVGRTNDNGEGRLVVGGELVAGGREVLIPEGAVGQRRVAGGHARAAVGDRTLDQLGGTEAEGIRAIGRHGKMGRGDPCSEGRCRSLR